MLSGNTGVQNYFISSGDESRKQKRKQSSVQLVHSKASENVLHSYSDNLFQKYYSIPLNDRVTTTELAYLK